MALSLARLTLALSGGAVMTMAAIAGCQAVGSSDARGAAATAPAATLAKVAQSEKGGAQLWSETCSRCHNLRSPSSYGPQQWEVAVYDMRVRANLTGEEQRKILAFLKAASQ